MTPDALRLAVIVGSTREGRFGPRVARWYTSRVALSSHFDADLIDLADVDVPNVLASFDDAPTPAVAALGDRLAAADAFVIVTPEYNHSFPASLKQAIDHYRVEWHAKPVALVSYGGVGGGLRAAEHLRLVFAELHALTIRDSISFHNAWDRFDADGNLFDGEGSGTAVSKQLLQLSWWSRALRSARSAEPYTP